MISLLEVASAFGRGRGNRYCSVGSNTLTWGAAEHPRLILLCPSRLSGVFIVQFGVLGFGAMAKVFLSYSVQDGAELARKIEKGLGNKGHRISIPVDFKVAGNWRASCGADAGRSAIALRPGRDRDRASHGVFETNAPGAGVASVG